MPHDFQLGQGLVYHKTTISDEYGKEMKLFVRAIDLYGNVMDTSAVFTFKGK
jgi:hypothetical protein